MSDHRDELPLPDYDHLPVPALRDRIRSLTADQLERLLAYEREHADRTPVVTVMRARLDQLARGATPSEGQHDVRPEQAGDTAHGSVVGEDTSGAPVFPPPHGVPAQPARPKGDRRA
ncbi:hypothetical protein [Saccharomonospora xinjiangensis]|uniref:DUF8129 domain-containing protein n=1 Tax=Saccharomonospora xinjiangensis XJ-54 TaxID=882086 RepID=I0UX35_9PSEU|nr:hypothetical protein [Saccharomonospora xinjiangensis]EID52438.1 hypothetical protein SacxiDRAFT_0156 [Saccharomonospora xinjiangensis XJ-54]